MHDLLTGSIPIELQSTAAEVWIIWDTKKRPTCGGSYGCVGTYQEAVQEWGALLLEPVWGAHSIVSVQPLDRVDFSQPPQTRSGVPNGGVVLCRTRDPFCHRCGATAPGEPRAVP